MVYIVNRPYKIENYYLLHECAGVYDDFHLAVSAAKKLYNEENNEYKLEEGEDMEVSIDIYNNNSPDFERILLNDIKP